MIISNVYFQNTYCHYYKFAYAYNKQYQPVLTIMNKSLSFVRKCQSTTPDFWGENVKNTYYCAAFDKLCILFDMAGFQIWLIGNLFIY